MSDFEKIRQLYKERIVPYPWQGEHEDDEKYAAIVREYKNESLLQSFDRCDGGAVEYRKHVVIRKEILKRILRRRGSR